MFLWHRLRRKKSLRRRQRQSSPTYLAHKEVARSLIASRVALYAGAHGFTYKRIAIKNTKRSWGSCSSKGNLNFNFKLLFLPPCLRDYIIVHELCHLRVLNHSQAFWDELLSCMPDALERAATLRVNERRFGVSVPAIQKYQPAVADYDHESHLKQYRSAVLVPPEREGS